MSRPLNRRLRGAMRLVTRLLEDVPRILEILLREIKRRGLWVASQYTFDHVVRLSLGAPPEVYSRITDKVHVGGQYTAGGWRRLHQRGITAVLNMREEFDDAAAGISPSHYLYLPTIDDTP